jgi:hypothetical protein
MLQHLVQRVVVVGSGSLDEFPRILITNGRLEFSAYQQEGVRDIFDVLKSRVDFYLTRLALADEKIFSHSQTYVRPKL